MPLRPDKLETHKRRYDYGLIAGATFVIVVALLLIVVLGMMAYMGLA